MEKLNKTELQNINGGNQPVATYLTSNQIEKVGNALANSGAFIYGFIRGFLGF